MDESSLLPPAAGASNAENSCTSGDRNGNGTLATEEGGDASEAVGEADDIADELLTFRQQWQRELEQLTPPNQLQLQSNASVQSEQDSQNFSQNIEMQARHLFQMGISAEQCGKLYEAVAFYRRAVQLVPDIEFRIADDVSKLQRGNVKSLDHDSDLDADDVITEDEDDDEDDESDLHDLVSRFQRLGAKHNCTSFCQPKEDQKVPHISLLPVEVFLYILKWVVSSDLDLHSLEQLAMVCRGFYLCARDPEIWRLACLRIWGVNCGLPNRYASWREMCLFRPRVNFSGAYISRTTYVRYGDASCQDSNYKPCYLVEYFRYLRFFPEGGVLMLTTPDDPYQSLPKLLHRKPNHPNVMKGHFRLVGSMVTAVLKRVKKESGMLQSRRHRRHSISPLSGEQEQNFNLELEVHTVKGHLHKQLVWRKYSIHTYNRNGQTSVSHFDLTPTAFPPFWFSRVRSFTARSASPLV